MVSGELTVVGVGREEAIGILEGEEAYETSLSATSETRLRASPLRGGERGGFVWEPRGVNDENPRNCSR